MPPPNVFEYLSRRFSLGDRVLDKRVYNQLESRLLRRRCTVLGWCSPSLRGAAASDVRSDWEAQARQVLVQMWSITYPLGDRRRRARSTVDPQTTWCLG
ncbi:hypothetical protein PC112_g17315 [Phytophthora cactorum]|nr:hypothetical protein PC112_g17315 [Phytophthora cactorum]